jgi:nucleotide-binding universal stress UspA family protein
MINLRHVLVPIDFSETSEAALKYGIALARAFKAKLHLLHVPEHPGVAAEAEYPLGIFETMQNAAHDRLGALLTARETRELKPELAMRIGKPSAEIIRYAQNRGIDLIVMGTHGRTGVAHVLMGSVAERVVRSAPCPVLTVHSEEREFVFADEVLEEAGAAR